MGICRMTQGTQTTITTQKGKWGRKMGGKFKREGTHRYLWLIDVDVWQKSTKFCKAILLQLKISKLKKNKHMETKQHSTKKK